MPVVINEFEVIPEAAPPAEKGDAKEAEEKKLKEKPDLETSLRLQSERFERVRAH